MLFTPKLFLGESKPVTFIVAIEFDKLASLTYKVVAVMRSDLGKAINKGAMANGIYRGCQKNVPIEDRFSATNPYAAIIFSEHYYDKRYIFRPPA